MEKILNFKVIITQDEDGAYVAKCPAIPGCHTQGETHEEALKNIEEAVKLCLTVAKTDKKYRESIDFGQNQSSRFVGISEVNISAAFL